LFVPGIPAWKQFLLEVVEYEVSVLLLRQWATAKPAAPGDEALTKMLFRTVIVDPVLPYSAAVLSEATVEVAARYTVL
jgi:hypothetical protein